MKLRRAAILTTLVAVACAAVVSAAPAAVEAIRKLGGRVGKLDYCHANFSAADNTAFLDAIQTWNRHEWSSAEQKFKAYLKARPNGAWAGEAELHIGCLATYAKDYRGAIGHFERVLQRWPGSALAHKARIRLANLYFFTAEYSKAKQQMRALLKESRRSRDVNYATGFMRRIQIFERLASRGNKRASMDCGVRSLAFCLDHFGKKGIARMLKRLDKVFERDTSFLDLKTMAAEFGLATQGIAVTRKALHAIPTPFIAHFDYPEHFVVVNAVTDGRVTAYDPAEGMRAYSTDLFSRLWSGRALLFAKAQVPGSRLLGQAEMGKTVGGCCGPNWPIGQPGDVDCSQATVSDSDFVATSSGAASATSACPHGDCDSGGQQTSGCSGTTCGRRPPAGGMPRGTLNFTTYAVQVVDTPLFYEPGIGPPVHITVIYNDYETATAAGGSPTGDMWFLSCDAHYIVLPANNDVQVKRRNGRVDVFVNDGNDNFTPPPAIDDTLVKNQDGSYTLTIKKTKGKLHFSATHQGLTTIEDKYGNSLTFSYDANDVLTKITDASSRGTTFLYDNSGLLTKATDPLGRSAVFVYDGSSRLTKTTDMAGYVSTFTYDSDEWYEPPDDPNPRYGLIKTMTTPRGTTEWAMEPHADVQEQANNWKYQHVYRDDPDGHRRTMTWVGNVGDAGAIVTPDGNYFPLAVTGQSEHIGGFGLTDHDGDPWQHVTYYYDDEGRMTKVKRGGHPLDTSIWEQVNAASVVERIWLYDDNGNLTKHLDPFNQATRFYYDANDNRTKTIDPKGNATVVLYDSNNAVTKKVYPDNSQATWLYDDNGLGASERVEATTFAS